MLMHLFFEILWKQSNHNDLSFIPKNEFRMLRRISGVNIFKNTNIYKGYTSLKMTVAVLFLNLEIVESQNILYGFKVFMQNFFFSKCKSSYNLNNTKRYALKKLRNIFEWHFLKNKCLKKCFKHLE